MLGRRADEASDQLGGVRRAVGRLDAGNPAHQIPARSSRPSSARRGAADDPVLDGGSEGGIKPGSAEHDVEVGPGIGPADIPGADLIPGDTARAVAAEQVTGAEAVLGAAVVA